MRLALAALITSVAVAPERGVVRSGLRGAGRDERDATLCCFPDGSRVGSPGNTTEPPLRATSALCACEESLNDARKTTTSGQYAPVAPSLALMLLVASSLHYLMNCITRRSTAAVASTSRRPQQQPQQQNPVVDPSDCAIIPRNLRVFVVEDSATQRRLIASKFRTVAKTAGSDLTLAEYETVEAALTADGAIVDDPDAVVIVDQNLESAGGTLKGSYLVTVLRRADFKGLIVSGSSEPEAKEEHLRLGADLGWGKRLPKNDLILDALGRFYAARRQPHATTAAAILDDQRQLRAPATA